MSHDTLTQWASMHLYTTALKLKQPNIQLFILLGQRVLLAWYQSYLRGKKNEKEKYKKSDDDDVGSSLAG